MNTNLIGVELTRGVCHQKCVLPAWRPPGVCCKHKKRTHQNIFDLEEVGKTNVKKFEPNI